MNLVTEHLTIRELRMEDLEQFDRLGNSDFVLQYLCMFKMTAKAPETICNR